MLKLIGAILIAELLERGVEETFSWFKNKLKSRDTTNIRNTRQWKVLASKQR